MIYLVLVVLLFLGNNSFSLLPWYHIPGVFRLSDIGLLLIFVTLVQQFLSSPHRHRCFNAGGLFILGYLLMALMHVANASINYDQSIFRGLMQVRHQFYYLSYFVFLLVFARRGAAEFFMKVIVWLAVFIFIVALINYSGFTLFHHKWAEGHGVRTGITRAYIPAMDIIGLAFLWSLFQYTRKASLLNGGLIGTAALFLALLLRQTRGRIIAALISSAWLMYRQKNFKLLIYSAVILVMLSVAVSIWTKENILVSAIQTTYTDIKYQEGTWAGRMNMIDQALETFYENPIIGSGSSLIHGADDELDKDTRIDSYQADLGYIHWIKNYGAVGMVWLVALVIMIARQCGINRERYPKDSVSVFAEYQFVQIAFGFITINYLGKPSGILIFCLTMALLFSGTRAGNANIGRDNDVKR